MAFHSNIGGGQNDYLGLVVIRTAYSLLTKTPFVCKDYPGNLRIPIEATRHAQEELKCQYDKYLRVFHETRGVEREIIQKLILDVEEECIKSRRNRTNGQFTGTLFVLIQYLIVT